MTLTSASLTLAAAAAAAPTGPSQVDETVRTLEASGYNVIINRSGAAPLSQCTVSTVRARADLFDHRFPGRQLDPYHDHVEDSLRRRDVLNLNRR